MLGHRGEHGGDLAAEHEADARSVGGGEPERESAEGEPHEKRGAAERRHAPSVAAGGRDGGPPEGGTNLGMACLKAGTTRIHLREGGHYTGLRGMVRGGDRPWPLLGGPEEATVRPV